MSTGDPQPGNDKRRMAGWVRDSRTGGGGPSSDIIEAEPSNGAGSIQCLGAMGVLVSGRVNWNNK